VNGKSLSPSIRESKKIFPSHSCMHNLLIKGSSETHISERNKSEDFLTYLDSDAKDEERVREEVDDR